MSGLTKATLVVEQALHMEDGVLPAVRVIPHDDEGRKPRGKAGKGLLIVARKGETWADLLRTIAGYYEQAGDWQAFGGGDAA